MNKPHKHAALIKAWADDTSLVIQCRPTQCGRLATQWKTISELETITWNEEIEYRIKPKTIKYRLFLWEHPTTKEISVESTSVDMMMPCGGFIKWLGDWQEVVVE